MKILKLVNFLWRTSITCNCEALWGLGILEDIRLALNISIIFLCQEYADNLRESGIHGALISYEETFTIDTLANALRIPIGKGAIYKHLVSEFSPLLKSAR